MPTVPLLLDLAAFAISGAAIVLLLARFERFWGKPLTKRTDAWLRIALALMTAFLLTALLFDAFGRAELLWYSRFSRRGGLALLLGCLGMSLVPRRFLSVEDVKNAPGKRKVVGRE